VAGDAAALAAVLGSAAVMRHSETGPLGPEAIALWLARAMEPVAASKALLDAFLTRLPESARAAPEEWLETHGDAAPRDIAQLRLWRRRLLDGAPVPLDALHDLLTRLRSPPA